MEQIFKEDKEFFEDYKLKFKKELLKTFRELEIVDKLKKDLDSIFDTLFDSIFNLGCGKIKGTNMEVT
ncbi:MAG: hypothetical protein DSZ30_03250 [Aquificaceae bacterium]|nr:MAG: hypothetical protein DSZ30_03250 [Aquificaceae bacterium]